MDKLYRITEGSGIAPVALGVAPAYPCGPPTINGAVDVGVFVWKDCPSGEWRMKTAAGGGSKPTQVHDHFQRYLCECYAGLEIGDTVDSTSNPLQIAYALNTTGSGSDGVNYTPQDGARPCLKVDAPAGSMSTTVRSAYPLHHPWIWSRKAYVRDCLRN